MDNSTIDTILAPIAQFISALNMHMTRRMPGWIPITGTPALILANHRAKSFECNVALRPEGWPENIDCCILARITTLGGMRVIDGTVYAGHLGIELRFETRIVNSSVANPAIEIIDLDYVDHADSVPMEKMEE